MDTTTLIAWAGLLLAGFFAGSFAIPSKKVRELSWNQSWLNFSLAALFILPLGTILESDVDPKYTLTDHLWKYLRNYADKHKAAGNGFGFGLVTSSDVARTLSARYHKDGSEILVSQGNRRNPRRLTPRECARIMGFPDTFKTPVSDTQAYRQLGNSVVVPVVSKIAKTVLETLRASPRNTSLKQQCLPNLAA